MPVFHSNRLIAKALLLNESGEVIRKINCKHHQAIFDAMEQAFAKNNDYAGGINLHPMGNFLDTADAGIPPRTGLRVRMTDKIGRRSSALAISP